MLQQHSLEMALEEADGFYDEQLLRRANVSPFFSSCKALPTLEPTEFALTPTHRNHNGNSSIAPLTLELCGDSVFDDSKSLSRVSSWCDFSLGSDATTPLPPTRATHTASMASNASADAWDLFLGGKTPSGGAVTYALKTPTAQAIPAFPAFVGEQPASSSHANSGDPTALSPTHIDKKVLVTDSDLKLDAGLVHHLAYPRTTVGEPSGPLFAHKRLTTSARSTREKLFPQDIEVEIPARPRRALLSDQPGYSPSQSRHRFSPYGAVSPRHVRRDGASTVIMPRLPALSYSPRNSCSRHSALATSVCVIPLVEHHWKRMQQQQHALSLYSQEEAVYSNSSRRARRPLAVDTALSPQEYAGIFRAGVFSQHQQQRLSYPTDGSRYVEMAPPLPPPAPKPRKASKRKIGIYSPEARRERLRRFHEKRKQRVFHKRIKYDCRKRLANACPRVKGRFVRKHALAHDAQGAHEEQLPTEQTTPSATSAEVVVAPRAAA